MTPLNFDRYTHAEIQGFLDVIDRRGRQQRQQARKAKRRR